MTKTLRFAILERDDFTCQYCGLTVPEADLQVDHIVPEAAGGQTVPDNLITACTACNTGKAARLVRGGVDTEAIRRRLTKLRERRALLKKCYGEEQKMAKIADARTWSVLAVWCGVFHLHDEDGDDSVATTFFSGVRNAILTDGADLVARARDIAISRFGDGEGTEIDARKYLFGVLRNLRNMRAVGIAE